VPFLSCRWRIPLVPCTRYPERDAEGRIVRWYSLRTDIDDRKQAEDRLQLLLDVTNQVVSNLRINDVLRAISASVPAGDAM